MNVLIDRTRLRLVIACQLQWIPRDQMEETIVVSFEDCAKCFVQPMIDSPILSNKCPWPYEANRISYVECRMNFVLSRDLGKQDGTPDVESWQESRRVRPFVPHCSLLTVKRRCHHGHTKGKTRLTDQWCFSIKKGIIRLAGYEVNIVNRRVKVLTVSNAEHLCLSCNGRAVRSMGI